MREVTSGGLLSGASGRMMEGRTEGRKEAGGTVGRTEVQTERTAVYGRTSRTDERTDGRLAQIKPSTDHRDGHSRRVQLDSSTPPGAVGPRVDPLIEYNGLFRLMQIIASTLHDVQMPTELQLTRRLHCYLPGPFIQHRSLSLCTLQPHCCTQIHRTNSMIFNTSKQRPKSRVDGDVEMVYTAPAGSGSNTIDSTCTVVFAQNAFLSAVDINHWAYGVCIVIHHRSKYS